MVVRYTYARMLGSVVPADDLLFRHVGIEIQDVLRGAHGVQSEHAAYFCPACQRTCTTSSKVSLMVLGI